ncbi:transcription factor Adf-1-like [Rhopilema esculentum]|uniref:transcription factor Adf-1-like n=1 Tax=Rhopilema esculentum TaxID=499914 RepID=UPI0031D3AF5E
MAAKNINKELLIEAVRKLPCLYDTSKKEYKDEIVRENAWKTVCQEIFKERYESAKELGEVMNLARKTFKSLRDRFMKVRKEYKPSGSAGGEPIEPTWPFFKQLLFLAPFMKHRETRGNFVLQERESSKIKSTIDTECLHDLIGEARKGNEPAFQISDSTVTQDCTEDSFVELPATPLSYESAVPKNDRAAAGSPVAQLDSLRESTRPKNPKRPRQEKTPDNSQFLMKVIENTNQFISSASKREEPDEDDLYGQSIGKELKKLSAYQKSLAKLRIQQVLHEVRWSTQE